MLTNYIRTAMKAAHYEILAEDGVFYGEIPSLQGVFAAAETLEECRDELESVLEGWIFARLATGPRNPGFRRPRPQLETGRLMPHFGPISRTDLIRALRNDGWSGPFAGGRHGFMVRGSQRLPIPNPHRGDIGRQLLGQILLQARISRDEWRSCDH